MSPRPSTSSHVSEAVERLRGAMFGGGELRCGPAFPLQMLSLAAELQKEGWIAGDKAKESAVDAAKFIVERLHYLNTSRPTAVNLSEAVTKLGALVESMAVGDKIVAGDVALAFAKEAEKMLEDDVATNKAIGKAGAEAIKAAIGNKLKTRGINVLTHCNTGSLATAGYGTSPPISVLTVHTAWLLGQSITSLVSNMSWMLCRYCPGLHPCAIGDGRVASCILYSDKTVQPRLPLNCIRARV